jgi:LuxR family transcriptional regulator, maltose regulon positive regulatory protein
VDQVPEGGARAEPTARFQSTLPLVEAKFLPPTRRPATIDRPRLFELLMATGGPRVVAITAPPGYGKTTLLAQWLVHEPRPVAWLTVDDLDNDPAVLLSYLAAALDRILPVDASMRSALSAPRERILTTAVPRLATALDAWGRPAALVLDDAHRLVDRTSLDALTALLDHLPPSFRVVIASRREPDLGLARRRAAGDLLEIGTDLLALTEAETGAIAEAEGHPLGPDQARALTARTEGWVAGVHLATLDQSGTGDGAGLPGDISGRDRYIAAYFRSEFQRGLSDDDLAVLTRTSVLETVTTSSAVAVSGIPDAGGRIEAVARASLLVQELGTVGTVYRYHNLLRDFLAGELDRREPDARPDLHRRAAAWYLAARDLDRAVSHAIASGDRLVAAGTVTAVSLPTFYGGHAATVDRWISSFDVADFERNPPLAVIAGWMHLLTGRGDAADRMAAIADRSAFDGPPGDGSASFESQRAMLRAVMGRLGPDDALANAQLAASLEGADSPWRANALWLLGSARLLLGDVEAADAAFAEAIEAGSRSGGTAMAALAKRAGVAMMRGDWAAAEEFARKSRAQLAASHFEEILPSLMVYAVGARVAGHRGDLVGAREDLVRAQLLRPLASHAAPWFAVDALLEVARAYLALSDPPGAQAALREAEQIVRRRPALGVLVLELGAIRRQLGDAVATLAGSSTLTSAELRMLPLLPTYLSFQEIADRLLVSRNTVKTHAMAIYGKLQVSSRGEAVERAVELGLLEPFPGLEPTPRFPTD